MKKIISIVLAFTFILALSSCANQSVSISSTGRLGQHSVNLTKGPYAKENTEMLNMTEKDLKAKGITGKKNNVYLEYNYGEYKYLFKDGELKIIFKDPNTRSSNELLSDEELKAVSDEIKQQYIPNELESKYVFYGGNYWEYYSAAYCKKINGFSAYDNIKFELDFEGKLLDFYSNIGNFDGIDKLDFDYDKALEVCKKRNGNDIEVNDNFGIFFIGDDNCVYYRFKYNHEEEGKDDTSFDYKICTVDQAKAYSAKS